MKFSFTLSGENAIKVSAHNVVSSDATFYASLRVFIRQQNYLWLQDAVAAEASVTLFFNVFAISYLEVKSQLKSSLTQFDFQTGKQSPSLLTLPVHYGGEFGPDLEWVAESCAMTVKEVIQAHQDAIFTVTAVGFSPGFGYLKGLPKPLRLARRAEPRIRVPAGTVAIAEQYSAIYPQDSPGGWHLIGRCDESLFDITLPKPALFEVGQNVRFIAVD
ncbi:5-oxoprolinase subunit B family protein [Planctobacterium marinum]|uniref:Allophanate hydrolase n=1 Tax=Planctobacterium marinum TaxID=1631968 RepID=A0AA48KS70_9ALTE|nr:allophanate hydrolase [Planctobacterium marinum]